MTDAIYKEILEREKNNNIPTGVIYELITPCIRMLDCDWLLAVIFFANTMKKVKTYANTPT